MTTAASSTPQPPLVKDPADLTWKQGKAVNYVLPSTTFTDPQHEALTYVATLSDGSDLPDWLTFNPKTRIFSGIPPAGDSFSITVTATDTDGLSSSVDINVTLIDAPTAQAAAISAQIWTQGQRVDLILPDGAFADPQGQALTYSARLSSGAALPSWIHVNKTTGEITGTPPATISNMTIVESAADSSGLTASLSFSVTAVHVPTVSHHVTSQTALQGKVFRLSLANEFVDMTHQKLGLTVTLSDGSPLPDWLGFNAATNVLSGTGPASHGTLGILVTATNGSGATATDKFTLTTLVAPVLTHQTADQAILSGARNSFQIAADTFADPNGHSLTYTATLANGNKLPAWLHFNGTTLTFSGTPTLGNLSLSTIEAMTPQEWATYAPKPVAVEVVAHGAGGLTAYETFSLHFTNVPLVGV